MDGAPDSAKDKEFTFTVTLTAPQGITLAGKSFSAKKNGSGTNPVTVSDTNTITVTPKAGENFEILGLPAGTTYAVTEDTESAAITDYSLSTTNEGGNPNGSITSGNESNVKFKNTYSQDKTDFSFTKLWKNGGQSSTWENNIEVTLTGKKEGSTDITATYTIKQSGDSYTVAKSRGADALPETGKYTGSGTSYSFKFDNLPSSYTYTLTESQLSGYNAPEYENADKSSTENGIKSGGTITNSTGYALPGTGGTGLIRYMRIALLLMALGLILYIKSHERRKWPS